MEMKSYEHIFFLEKCRKGSFKAKMLLFGVLKNNQKQPCGVILKKSKIQNVTALHAGPSIPCLLFIKILTKQSSNT